MHIILTGATGFIGGEVLAQLIAHPAVTSITALTRRALPSASPKVKTILLDDFTAYPPAVLAQLASASACIYTLGTYRGDTAEAARRVNVDYTLAAARAFATHLAAAGRPFAFVYTSGFLAERDPARSLWLMSGFRKMRGSVETLLLALPGGGGFRAVVARPGFVRPKEAAGLLGRLAAALMPKSMGVRVDELAACMIDVALNGAAEPILENAELVDWGQEVLRKQQGSKEGKGGGAGQ